MVSPYMTIPCVVQDYRQLRYTNLVHNVDFTEIFLNSNDFRPKSFFTNISSKFSSSQISINSMLVHFIPYDLCRQ